MTGNPSPPGDRNPSGPPQGRLWKGLLAGAVVALFLGLAALSTTQVYPYAFLPYCDELLPAELVETIPGADRPHAEGDNVSVEGDEPVLTEEEPRHIDRFDEFTMMLDCTVKDADGSPLMNVEAVLSDTGDGMADTRDKSADVLAWRELSTADGGYAAVYSTGDGSLRTEAVFSSTNVFVWISRPLEEGEDGEEALEFVSGFADGVNRQLSEEGQLSPDPVFRTWNPSE